MSSQPELPFPIVAAMADVTGFIEGPNGPIVTANQTRVVHGIVLPWVDVNGYTHVEEGRGEVFVELSVLNDLAEQDRWDSQFGGAFLLGRQEGLALKQAGLAEQETRGGYHRTDALLEMLKREGLL